jgi:hypothetical protein
MTTKALDATSRTLEQVMRDLRALQVRISSAKGSLQRKGPVLQGSDLRSKLAYVESRLQIPPGTAQQLMNEIGMTPSEASGMTREQLLQILSEIDDAQGGGGRRRSKTSCGRVRSRRGRNHSRKRRN